MNPEHGHRESLCSSMLQNCNQRSSMTKIFHSSTTAIPLLGGATYTGTILFNAQLIPLSEYHCPTAPPSSGMAVVHEWNILVILNLCCNTNIQVTTVFHNTTGIHIISLHVLSICIQH